jgi:hypothetical protein
MSLIVSRRFMGSLAVLIAFALPARSAENAGKNAKANPSTTAARQQVTDALRAEAAGDNDRRTDLLASAARLASDLPETNWHQGRVLVADRWLSLDDAATQAINDPHLAEYHKLRDEAGENPKLLRGLARWCLKNGLADIAKLHYAQLLARGDIDVESQKEAIQRLDLQFVNGSWVTREDLQTQEDKAKAANEAIIRLRPKLKKIQQAIDNGDYNLRQRATKELEQIDNPQCISALETFLLDGGPSFQEAAVLHLAKFPDYSATETLVHFSVLSEFVIVRDQAIAALKPRSLHEFVPLLLAGLVAPIQSQYEVKALPNGVINYTHLLTRETPQQKVVAVAYDRIAPSFVPRRFQVPKGTGGLVLGVFFDDTMWAKENQLTQETILRAQENDLAVTLASQSVNFSNRRAFQALTGATQQQLPDTPQAWWQWWQDYNQYHWPQQTSISYSTTYSRYTTPPPVQVIKGASCFVAGTPVQTQRGPAPIESIRPGDRVLAQDQDTGELAQKLVLRTTIRPPTKMVRIASGGEAVTATLGHPFWVAGHGWKMAKELKPGDLLHCTSGAVSIDNVEPAGEEKAYNLVVADFNTYFVGPHKFLVHDNEFRKPTLAVVPGLIAPHAAATAAAIEK